MKLDDDDDDDDEDDEVCSYVQCTCDRPTHRSCAESEHWQKSRLQLVCEVRI